MKGTIYSKVFILLAVLMLTTSCIGDLDCETKGWLQVKKPSTIPPATSRAAGDEEIDYLVSVLRNNNVVVSPIRFSAISGHIRLSAE